MSSLEPVRLTDFEKLEELGEGAAGRVWRARALRSLPPGAERPWAKTGDEVALKIYEPSILAEPSQRERIEREYRTGSALSHSHLVHIHHFDASGDAPFLVMQLCDGSTLYDHRQAHTPDEEFLVTFAVQLLDALEFIHASRRQHRDIKPRNIQVHQDGALTLLDFGIARDLRATSITGDKAQRFLGTYRYSAPEYIFNDTFDYRSDLYSFGATLYYVLHGREVFPNISRTADMIRAKQRHDISFDATLGKGGAVFEACVSMARRCLDPDPESRPESALACLDMLASAVPHSVLPLRIYYACALTGATKEREQRGIDVAKLLRAAATPEGYAVYAPGEHTAPSGAPLLSSTEVYWIDRERVANSDLVCMLAEDPSHGAGQEMEIAGNAGVPVILVHRSGTQVSRMLRGTASRILANISYESDDNLRIQLSEVLHAHRNSLRLMRRSRESTYSIRLGRRIREARESAGVSIERLAELAMVNKELLETAETRPEKVSMLSMVQLRLIARGLGLTLAELVREQAGRDQVLEDLYKSSLISLRQFARDKQLSYATYAQLKAKGRQVLNDELDRATAARGGGTPSSIREGEWRDLYTAQLADVEQPAIAVDAESID